MIEDMTIGILGAMPEEIAELKTDLDLTQTIERHGNHFYFGTLYGHHVVLTQCGIGKVNAALTATSLLGFGIDQLIFTGVAGGLAPDLRIGDVVVSKDLLQHDIDVTALGYTLGQIPGEAEFWEADAALTNLALKAARKLDSGQVQLGRILSGDQFIADPQVAQRLYETFGGLCAEMEGAAVAQIAHRFKVPFVVIRSLSDGANSDAKTSYRQWMPIVARNAKAVVRGMLEDLNKN